MITLEEIEKLYELFDAYNEAHPELQQINDWCEENKELLKFMEELEEQERLIEEMSRKTFTSNKLIIDKDSCDATSGITLNFKEKEE